ncbi:hypothetical protein GCM10027443_31210 [Pontibacter brevis]
MKHDLPLRKVLRSILFSAAVATAACTFTACDPGTEEGIEPQVATLQSSSENGAIIPGQYIVVFKDNSTLRFSATTTYEQRVETVREMGQEILATNGVKEVAIEQAYGKAILGVAAKLSESEVENLKKDPRVDYVEPDRMVVLAKPDFAGGGGGSTPSEETPWGVTRVGLGDGTGKTAWVIDSGIDLDHPDLNVDAQRSRTFVTTGRDAKSPDDGNGHGTHVAGTIAAIKDGKIGVVGVAYNATVVAVKVLDSRGSGSYSGVIAGVDYVAANGVPGDVANMSLGGPVSDALDAAVIEAAQEGIKFSLAAGNESTHAENSSPARANHNNIFTVSAMSEGDIWASFSNYGNPPVDYCAPGVSIKSTWKDGGYNTISGTSMAAPHVAGLLLLGELKNGGTVSGDPDGNHDVIAVH